MKTLRLPVRHNAGLACLDRRFPPQTTSSLAFPAVPKMRLDVVPRFVILPGLIGGLDRDLPCSR
jgi:hypothetical protein